MGVSGAGPNNEIVACASVGEDVLCLTKLRVKVVLLVYIAYCPNSILTRTHTPIWTDWKGE